ncbi:MAG: FAD-dependent oxidoreductase [Vicinamibacterales bacterium]
MPTATIVGAGVAGLTIADRLAANGYRVTIVEQHDRVGGLARSWHYGDFHFDIGPHRFHTENARVAAYIREVLGSEAIEISRKSGVRMFGRFHDWPLRPAILASMPFALMVRGSRDLVFREHLPGDSFEADVINKYGRTLYEIFFKPYTEKFIFYSPADLHRDWGRAGVNRAVIDKRASADTLWSLLRSTLMPKPVETTFLYPPSGIGRFAELLADRITARGGRVVLGKAVSEVVAGYDSVTGIVAGDETIDCEKLVWTAPITALDRQLGLAGVDLEFLSTVFYNFNVRRPAKRAYQWIYFGGDEIFSRISVPVTFAKTMAPEGKSGLSVELTCREGDERWRDPGRYVDAIASDLARTGTIDSRDDIEDVHVEPVANTYPVYKLNYLQELTRNLKGLGRYRNLLLAGRCGRFWYNNMDHSIGQGLTVADRILRGDRLNEIDSGDREFWTDTESAPAAAAGP